MAKPQKATTQPEPAVPPLPRLLARLTGARLCFGRPVSANGRTVIPVASVRSAGGGGFGRGGPPGSDGSGGGGGGALEARPVGFIEISSEGTRFERIDDGRTALRALATGSLALLIAGRVLTRRRRRGPEAALGGGRLGRRAPAIPAPPAQPVRRGLLRGAHSSQRS